MKFYLLSLFTALIVEMIPAGSFAQTSDTTKLKKFKPPVVKSMLGIRSSGDTVTTGEADQLIGLPLKVVDRDKNNYTISSYKFLYKRKGSIINEETGRENVVFSTVSDLFKSTPLPAGWIKSLKGNFQRDEEILFFDIIVKDKNERVFYAPNLKIYIE
jgi:hypothetical protein